MVTQLFATKDEVRYVTSTIEQLDDSSNTISLPSSSNTLFKVEANLEITTFDGQVNAEKLNS